MSIFKKIVALIRSLIKEDPKSAASKYFYPLQVFDAIDTINGVKVTVDVPDDVCYIINNIPITSFSNQIFIIGLPQNFSFAIDQNTSLLSWYFLVLYICFLEFKS
jgi:hypothetical protein